VVRVLCRVVRYLGPAAPVTNPEVLARIKALVIPLAWEDVWIARTREATSRRWGPRAAQITAAGQDADRVLGALKANRHDGPLGSWLRRTRR
jgi:DNA topoisomerase IB